jgi:two-component sensor histidine kinase
MTVAETTAILLAERERHPLRVLLVDDNQDDRRLAIRELQRGFPGLAVHEITSRREFEEHLEGGHFDITITDFQLGWGTGLEVLREIKQRFGDCPVIMFSATASQEDAIEAMKSGLDDYVVKSPKHYARLPAAVRRARENVKLAADKRHAEQELQRAYEHQKRLTEERELLLREVYHRVKNNMQIVSSLLDLQSGQIDDPKARDLLRISMMRVRSMALIHEKLYQSKDLTGIVFADYVRDLANDLFASYGVPPGRIAFDVTVGIGGDTVTLDTAVPCGLIINELVSNAIKYGFPDGREGAIRVSLISNYNETYTLTVADTGVGLPPDLDILRVKSLGLHLVRSLAQQQLRGTLACKRSDGTEFEITFPHHTKSQPR